MFWSLLNFVYIIEIINLNQNLNYNYGINRYKKPNKGKYHKRKRYRRSIIGINPN